MKTLTTQLSLFVLLVIFGVNVCIAQTTSSKTQATSGYHLLKKFQVGGEGGWDYLYADSSTHRLYISRSTHVMILDTETGAIVGDIPNTNGVHGIAIAEDLGRGFTSNGRDNSVTIFDLKTLKTLGTVATGKNPDAIIYDSATRRVFTLNGGSSNATAIDAVEGKVAGTIDLGGRPEFATSDGKGMVFVNLEDKSQVVAIDSRKLDVKGHWSIAPGEEPSGMAIDRKTQRLFIVCSNKKMMVVDAGTGIIKTTLPIGDRPDAAGFDPETKLAFSSNGEGTLTVVREDSADRFSVVENVTTQPGAKTMALDTKTHNVFLGAAQYGETPAKTEQNPRPRPKMIPDSFVILVFGK